MDNDMSMVEELPVYVLPRCIVQFLNTLDGNGDADGKIVLYIILHCNINYDMKHYDILICNFNFT